MPEDSFVRNRSTASGRGSYCRPCHTKKVLAYRARNPEKVRERTKRYELANADRLRERRLKYQKTDACRQSRLRHYAANRDRLLERKRRKRMEKTYGIPFDKIVALRAGGCMICGATETGRWGTLQADHDHKTGAFRGILCVACNWTVGRLGDDSRRARRIADYIDGTLQMEHGGKLA